MGRLITEEDVARFAELSGDRYRLHTDPVFAASKRFGRPIAHGMLTAAAASGMLFERGIVADDVEALVEVNLRFVAPVYPGDELEDATVLVETRPTRSGGVLERYRGEVSARGGERVLDVEWLLLRTGESR